MVSQKRMLAYLAAIAKEPYLEKLPLLIELTRRLHTACCEVAIHCDDDDEVTRPLLDALLEVDELLRVELDPGMGNNS